MATRGAAGAEATLLERSEEIERLGVLLARAQEGVGGLMLVEGSAGLGKSRLLRWAVDSAAAGKMHVRRARGGEAERAVSFGVVLQLLEGWLASAESAEREEVLSGVATLALSLFEGRHWESMGAGEDRSAIAAADGHPDPHGVSVAAAGSGHDALLHGLFWLVSNLASRQPLLLAVDDAHWSDPVSLRFLVYLAQRIDELPVALLLAHRPGEGDRRELIEELAAHPAAEMLALSPLSPAAVAQLLAHGIRAEVGDHFARACFEASAGNPFLAWAIVRALQDDGIAPADANAPEIARLRPEMLGRQALVRISRIGPDAMRLASAAAVVAEDAPLAHVASLAGLEDAAAATASDALAAADVFAGADPVSFAHPLLRKAVYDEIPEAQRRLAHLRAAELLQSEHAPVEQVAGQLLSTSRSGEQWAIAALRGAAAEALLRGNPSSAVAYLARMLAEPLPPDERAEALLELGRSEALIGSEDAKGHIEEALSLIDDPRACAEAQKALGDLLYTQGDLPAAAGAFERGLQLMDGVEDALTRDLHAGYFSAASLDSALAPVALRHIQPLLERPAGDETPTERAVLASLAAHEAITGVPREQVIALARRAWGDGALLADEGPEGWGWHLLTAAFGWTGALTESLEISRAVIEQARERGLLMAYATASYCAQLPTLGMGEISEARALGESVMDARRFGWRAYPRAAAAVLAETLIEQDDLEGAQQALAVLDDDLHAEAVEKAPALVARGRLRLLQGRPADALADMVAAGETFEKIGGVNTTVVAWRTGAALAAWQLGDERRADELLAKEREIALRTGVPTHVSGELVARAQTVGAADEVDLLRSALEALDCSESALERLRCRAALGSALRRSGLRAQARATLEEALETAHSFGARRIERIVHGELKVAGARPRRLRFSGPDSLTASERRIADMAAMGMGNKEIAQALFVTTRTVEQHLYNSYKKLGISSRAQLEGSLAGED